MSRAFSRRTLLQGALAAAMPPLLPAAARAQPREVDVVIVGAGAAGIAAARRLAAQARSHVVLEAQSRIGGRVMAAAAPMGTPADLGADRLYTPESNPLAVFASSKNLDLYPPLISRRLFLPLREARDSEYDNFTAAVRRAARAIAAVGEAGRDVPASEVLPDLNEWQETAAFLLGPLNFGTGLSRISTLDFSRMAERNEQLACKSGMAALFTAAALGVPVQLNTPVRTIQVAARRNVSVETVKGTLRAHAVIVTASPGVLAANAIRFAPGLPDQVENALERLTMGAHNRVVFELLGNPLQFRNDETVLFKAEGQKTMRLTGRVGGTDLAYADVGGAFARELSTAGERAMIDYAIDTLVQHFGTDVRKRIGWSTAVRWEREEWIRGAHAVASPGFASDRRALTDPIHGRIFFAGEALHESRFGTLGGAWASGERAANAALRVLPARR